MSCCQTLANIGKSCGGNMGGVKKAYVTCYTAGLISDPTSTTITFPTGTCFYELDFFRETSSFTVEAQFIENQFAAYFAGEITLQLNKLTTANNTAVKNLLQSELCIIVTDNNNQNWFFGMDYPVIASAGSAASGTAFTDLSGYTLTFASADLSLPANIPQSSITVCS